MIRRWYEEANGSLDKDGNYTEEWIQEHWKAGELG